MVHGSRFKAIDIKGLRTYHDVKKHVVQLWYGWYTGQWNVVDCSFFAHTLIITRTH